MQLQDTRKANKAKQADLYSPSGCGSKTRKDTKQCTAKHEANTEPYNGSNAQQRIIRNRTVSLECTAA